MCQIVYQKDGNKLSEKNLQLCVDNNTDGFGFMFVAGGRVKVERFVGFKYEGIKRIIDSFSSMPAAYHLRWNTVGSTSPDNVHPFRVAHKERDGRDIFVMHNGTFSGLGNTNVSDTVMFNNMFLKPILQKNPDLLHDPTFLQYLDDLTDGNRLLFMDDTGYVATVGDFTTKDKCMVANLYSFDDNHRDGGVYFCPECYDVWKDCVCWDFKSEGYASAKGDPEAYETVEMVTLEAQLTAMSSQEVYLWVLENPIRCRDWFAAVGSFNDWVKNENNPDILCDLINEDLGKINMRAPWFNDIHNAKPHRTYPETEEAMTEEEHIDEERSFLSKEERAEMDAAGGEESVPF